MATAAAEATTELIGESALKVVSAITEAWQSFITRTPEAIDNRAAFAEGFLAGALWADKRAMQTTEDR